ncbi:S8 family serine peptidase [Gammaproteobacteria bacterium]|nr:S8 family serine peptidase [Gammaproteobacteria bacterium]
MKNLHILFALLLISTCGGGGGGGSAPVAPTPNISVTLSASANSADVNSSITLTWSSTLATSCSASGSWSGSKATSGSESITIGVGGSNTFSLSCSASGANSGNASTTVNGLRYFDGKVFDGYIRGAEVFVDTNNNSTLDSDETSVTTDNQGNFTKLLYADGSVISKGGIDLDTGADLSSLTLAHKMVGFEATKIISPITSLAAYMAKPEDINAALGINASIDLMSIDPIPNLGQSEYDYIYEKGNQLTVIAYSLQNSVNAINQTAETSQDYFLSIAEEIEKSYAASPGLVDIESNAFIEAVVENIIAKKASSMDATNKINMTSAISSVVPLIQVKSNAATTTAIQNFAFRTMQTDIQSLATGGASTGTVDNYNTNILTYISADQNISSTDLEIDISALSDSASLDEDSSIEISPLTNDSYLRGQAVQLSIATSPANGSASLANEVITYTPDADWNGSESFTYSIVQGSKSATGTIEVTVVPINDAPVINAASEFSVNETIQSVATISATDADQDDLTYSLSGTDAELFAISSTGVLTFVFSPDFENPADSDANNIYDLTVSVSDGTLVDEQTITVTVVNTTEETDPPVLVSYSVTPTTVNVTDGTADIEVSINITDETGVDQSSLPQVEAYLESAYSATWFQTPLTLSSGDKTNGTYTATVTIPQNSLSGSWTILTSSFKDENGTSMSPPTFIQSVEVVVTASNNSPTITSSATFSAAENQTAIGTVTATDADGDSLTYSISGSEINISSSGVLTFATAPDYETKNSYTATVTVTDGTASVTQDIAVNVTDVSEVTNQAPVITSSATFSAAENQTDIGTVTATDADGDSLTYSISGSEINISSSGVLTFVSAPDYETKNSYTATVTVSDGTASVTQDITVNVTDLPDLTVSGTVFSSRYYVMDSDVPNVNNHGFSSNDSVATAQELTNPSIVNGFVGEFTTVDNVTVVDTIDVYKITTSSNMYVNLDVSQYESDIKDLDILLYDAEGSPVEFSYAAGSTEENETINLPNDGTYLIAVSPVNGSSRYLLTLGQRFSSSSIEPQFNYVEGEVLSYIPFVKAGKPYEFSDSKFIDPIFKERFNRLSGFQDLEPLVPGLRNLKPAELISKFEDDISASLSRAGLKPIQGKMLRYLAQNKVINRLRELNPDAVFDFNHKVKKMVAFSKDPLNWIQWNMERIGLETSLNVVGQELKNVGVAVLDSGGPTVNSDAWNSTNFISGGYDFVDSDTNPTDPDAEVDNATTSSHGTHVATTIGAKNDGNDFNGFPVSVLNVRVLGPDGGSDNDIANAILYSAGLSNSSGAVAPTNIPIKVINLSLGGANYNQVLCSAVTDARAQGLVVVAASGNEQEESPGLINYPAACPGVISVGATNSAGEITTYSNQNVYVDISAPGGDAEDRDGDGNGDYVWAWGTNTDFAAKAGTSMASPHVAGAIATLYAADTSMTPARVDSMLQSGKLTTDLGASGVDNIYGYGELNLPKMLENLYADNNANSVTFAYTNKYFMDFSNTVTQLDITLNKVGTGSLSVSSLGADSAVGLSYTDNSSNGFGSYTIFIDRASMPNGEFSNTLYFNLSDDTSVAVPIYYSVGTPRTRASLGKLYVAIYNAADNSTVASGELDMNADGTLGFVASELANGNYYLLSSTDPDNDGFVCDYGELCQYYPEFSSSDDYFTLSGSNISGYEISLSPRFKFGGVQSASLESSDRKNIQGIKRESVDNKILPLSYTNTEQRRVFGEKKFISNSK